MKNRALTNLEFGNLPNNRALSNLEFGNIGDNRSVSSLEFNMPNNISKQNKESKIVFKKIIRLKNGELGMFFVFSSGNRLILPLKEKK